MMAPTRIAIHKEMLLGTDSNSHGRTLAGPLGLKFSSALRTSVLSQGEGQGGRNFYLSLKPEIIKFIQLCFLDEF